MGEMADAIVDQFSASPGFRYYPRAVQREVVTFELGKDDVDELTHPLEPLEDGWYRSVNGNNWLLYSRYHGAWFYHTRTDSCSPCTWDYIEQAGPIAKVAS